MKIIFMWIGTLLSCAATAATLLSLVFHVPDNEKILISQKMFLGLLSATCLIFFVISLISEETGNTLTDNDKGGSLPASALLETNGQEQPNFSADADSKVQEENIDQSSGATLTEGVLPIASIVDNEYNVAAIEPFLYEIQPVDIITFSGEISEHGQYVDYSYVPALSGGCRFEFSDVPNGTDFNLGIYNSGWEEIVKYNGLDNGEGIFVYLKAGETYYIRVIQYNNYGAYTVNVGQKKETFDIGGYTAITDSIQYRNQENDYVFTAENGGTHRFEFSNVPNGTDLNLGIYNSGWEEIVKYNGLDNGDGLTVSLTAGESYYLRVKQYEGIGSYTLNVGSKKRIDNISNYTAVNDSIQYTDQVNNYEFTVENDGTHRFEFSNVPNGTDLNLGIYNSGWEEIVKYNGLDNGDGLTVSLTAGESYYLMVQQYESIGPYTLNIGSKKKLTDFGHYMAIADCIQYTDQKNDYLFVPDFSGSYSFTLSDVPAGNNLQLKVYNSGWEEITSRKNLSNNERLDVTLEAGESYYIQVCYYDGYGKYTLTVKK